MTEPKTFEDIETWRQEFIQSAQIEDPQIFPFVVVGTKTDIGKTLVSEKTVGEYCGSIGQWVPHIFTSAKEGTNVNEMFGLVVKAIQNYLIIQSDCDSDLFVFLLFFHVVSFIIYIHFLIFNEQWI